MEAVGSDSVDLVDLEHAGGLLRYRAAQDGVLLFERQPGEYERFWLDAVLFWCDAGPILQAGHEDTLRRLRA